MFKFITFTFLLLGWAFYEMSGGADFVPEGRTQDVALAPTESATPESDVQVTRTASAASLVALPAAVPAPVAPEATVTQASLAAISPSFDLTEEEAATLAAAQDSAPEVEVPSETAPQDLRYVAGSWVNMRDGRGTEFAVLDTLAEGTEVEVIEVDATGWARLRVTDTGQEGWMAERFLSDS